MDRQVNAPPEARRVVDFLRTKSGMKVRPGVLNGQRADYFKGSSAIKAVLSPEYAKLKNVPKVTSEEEAEKMLHNLLPFAFFLRVERGDKPSKKDERRPLQVNQMQMFEKDMYYAWFYEGQQLMMKLAGLGMVAVMLAAVMFPLWPRFMRVGVWYLSLGVLGLFGLLMVIAVLRLIFWLISIVVLPPGIWVFPNLFADVGVIESFIPLWAWDVPPPKAKKAKKGKKTKRSAGAPAPGDAPDDAAGDAAADVAADAAPDARAEKPVAESIADLN
ncbi:Translocation protein S62 [Malassezia obtusa]|uniref:Translocation protein SEC62 n=1 Tax=Malassezia obtusa TaxID=76774 RepID=A0AAF0E179_9BASI|nr:Translocation protein S62 [Malassezia obtusa]